MSVDSKLFVTCGKDKLPEVMNNVIDNLNVYHRAKLDNYWQNHTDAVNRIHFLRGEDYRAQNKTYTNGVSGDFYNFDVLSLTFGNGDENLRMLQVFPDCSCDYSDTYEGDKIIFSVGCWGMYDEIMKVVAKSVAPFGDVYYDFNDCDEEDFVKLEG
tara:strand:- start:2351 stop:2818 length:468 start_codon:yes stop_codon:yes gene_type:complete